MSFMSVTLPWVLSLIRTFLLGLVWQSDEHTGVLSEDQTDVSTEDQTDVSTEDQTDASTEDQFDMLSDDPTPTRLSDFDMFPSTGFLPDQAPLQRLPPEFDLWELALDTAPRDISLGEDENPDALAKRESSLRWRLHLRDAPVLPTESLYDDVPSLKRAHHVLTFLVHFYMHSVPPASDPGRLVVPASLAVPLVAVSDVLSIAPILTFADTVLWNWALVDPTRPPSPDNLKALTLFTGGQEDQGKNEENFYVCCASIELRGVEALDIMIDYLGRDSLNDPQAVEEVEASLKRLAFVVDDLITILKGVRATCDPQAFYFRIRPWYRGSDANGPDTPGWVYEGVDPSRHLELSGPSAGQSSTMHAIDVFLDVDHELVKRRLPAPSEQNVRADHSFMMRMRKYMPGKHQNFLLHLAAHGRPIREFARRTPALRKAYDSVVLALKAFRDQHMRIACLYVVSMSRSAAATAGAKTEAPKSEGAVHQPIRGTGGNELSALLKASRDATIRTALKGNIR